MGIYLQQLVVVLSKGAPTNPLFSVPQHIPEDLGRRWTKGWTTCSAWMANACTNCSRPC